MAKHGHQDSRRSGFTGALAIVCAVPLTTFIAALVIPARKKSLHYDKSKQWLNHAQRTTHSE